MANLYVLRKILKLRSINQLIPNCRQLASLNSLPVAQVHVHPIASNNGDALLRNLIVRKSIHNPNKTFNRSPTNHRSIYSFCRLLNNNKSDNNSKNPTVDEFRANEEKIEREYEEQQNNEQSQQDKHKQSSNIDNEEHAKIQEIRTRILDASLQFVNKHGWSREAITKGAESINYPSVAHGMFPNGAIELIHHFYAKCNQTLIDRLQAELNVNATKTSDTAEAVAAPNPVDFTAKALRMRLEMIVPYLDTWPQALAIMTLPQNVPTSLAQLLTLVDDICYCAGDRSVDIGWYTRRVGIASILKMTELYMLQDKSESHQQTWEFLQRRLEEGVHIQELFNSSDQKTKNMAHALTSAFKTARNILGINYDKR